MSAYATNTDSLAPRGNWFTRSIDWLDANGPGAWIALMVAGFVFAGPFGLVVLAFMLVTGRFGRRFRDGAPRHRRMGSCRQFQVRMSGNTGNAAFDSYKADTLQRLEREQNEFEAFLHRLRESRDKAEFDQYLAERARAAAAEAPAEPEAPKGSGAY
ncbi:DUF2852 domain-containing protein [Phaeovulum sp.]|uniref:DUF2852 domain-containing protein n=1 Tax=Phaeovulum sp. TaxID=2934796 RepID=UPI003564CDE0